MAFFRQIFRKLGVWLSGLFRRLAVWMSGRNGLDQLSLVIVIVSTILQAFASLMSSWLLLVIGFGLYGWALFRIFSRKSVRRAVENQKFLGLWALVSTKIRQFFTRLKNGRRYKYFKCPQCKALLRLTRGQGEREVCCPQCQHRFRQKA